jgi:hypothetical protein
MSTRKNTATRSRRAAAPNKTPKTKPAAIAPEAAASSTANRKPKPELPEWLEFQPLADYRLIAWDSDENSVEVLLTSDEYIDLRNHLAELRGYRAPAEATHA